MEMNDRYSLETSMGMIIRKAQSVMHQRLFMNFRKAGLEVSPEQWGIMLMLMKNDGIKQNEIAEWVGRNDSSITRIIDNLSQKGYVERRPHENDRRVNLIYLTEEGKSLQQKLIEAAAQTQKEARESIDAGELEICRKVLYQIINNLS